MFTRSADDSLQGQAIQAINVKWGEDVLARVGRESLALPVCKKKYKPFQFAVQKVNGVFQVTVERRYACACHDDARRKGMCAVCVCVCLFGQHHSFETRTKGPHSTLTLF